VAISQVVKQTISVRSGNDLRREMAATGSFGESVLPRRLAIARSASVASSIGTFIFMVEDTWERHGAAISHSRDFPVSLARSFVIPR
jgi:hypothetical protein